MIAVRSGSRLSEPMPLKLGVRQECPLSPVLFNIFIYHVLDGAMREGSTIPGMTSDTKIPGLLFADDLVTMAPNGETLVRMADHLSSWTTANEMAVIIRKCSVMVV